MSDAGLDEGLLCNASREHVDLVSLLNRGAVLRAALELLSGGRDVAWVAEPSDDGALVLRQVRGDHTGLLRGLHVPSGLGLTGKVYACAHPAWVDDYFTSSDITHTFDRHIDAEGVRRLLAVPVLRQGKVLGVLAVGARDIGAFGDRAVERVNAVADELALAVAVAERAQLAREVAIHEERARIAAGLHDSVGALLFAIGSGVAELAETVADDPDLASRLERLQRQTADASIALRASVRTLHSSPSALELAVALQADCAAFSDRTGTPADLVVINDPPPVAASRADVLVGAVREALLNVEKHARAHAVVVTVSRGLPDGRDGTIVAVTDDGGGLPADYVPGIGLASTARAVGRLGGALHVASDPHDGGTLWRIEVPC